MMTDRENICFLLFEKLMSHLEQGSHNKGSAYAMIMSKRKLYYRCIVNWYAKEMTLEKIAKTTIVVPEV